MAEFRTYMWSVPDWRTDEMYTMLDNREKGVYRELIDECWVAGSITADMDVLARFVREPLEYFRQVWSKIQTKFRPVQNGERLISTRLEQDRRRKVIFDSKHHKRAQKAAETRWNNYRAEQKLHATSNASSNAYAMLSDAQTQIQIQREEGSPLIDSPNNSKYIVLEDTPPAEKRGGRPRDHASDLFCATCLQVTGAPYVCEAADFVMLAKLRKACHVDARARPPGWEDAVVHYFESALGQYSLADLANPKRYPVFKNSALDAYNKPITHRSNGHGQREIETKGEQSIRKQKESGERVREFLRGSTGDGTRTGDSAGTHADVHPGTRRPD